MSIQLPQIDGAQDEGKLVDRFGRKHNNLRISVTDRCNLRCTYCMPEEVEFLKRSALLTYEQITTFVGLASTQGINKVRLTGGEPLLRRDLPRLVAMLKQVKGIDDLGLTTNGLLLSAMAKPLFDAGLQRINISLDTLNPDTFKQLTRREGLDLVLQGIEAAQQAGFNPVKINAVSIRGVTDREAVPLAQFARANDLELRFIEYMPIGADAWERSKVYFAHEIIAQLEEAIAPLMPASDYDHRNPSMDFQYADGKGRVGFIASISRPFCHQCNRIRLTAEGKLRNCLFSLQEFDVKPFLTQAGHEAALLEVIHKCVQDKWEGHEINTSRFIKPTRNMHAIGG